MARSHVDIMNLESLKHVTTVKVFLNLLYCILKNFNRLKGRLRYLKFLTILSIPNQLQ